MRIILDIPGIPVAKGRPRLGRFGTYTPKKTKDYEDKIRLIARGEMVRRGLSPSTSPLVVEVTVSVPIPQSATKKFREQAKRGDVLPVTRPDLDNYLKCLDALNEIVWKDDSQICTLAARKVYGENPGLHIIIEEVVGNDA